MVIIESDIATSFYKVETKVVTTVYRGRANPKLIVNHLSKLGEFYAKNIVVGSISDLSNVYASFSKIFDFLENTYPNVAKSGLKCTAIVVPKDIIIENLSLKIKTLAKENNIEAEIFIDIKESEEWLKSNI